MPRAFHVGILRDQSIPLQLSSVHLPKKTVPYSYSFDILGNRMVSPCCVYLYLMGYWKSQQIIILGKMNIDKKG